MIQPSDISSLICLNGNNHISLFQTSDSQHKETTPISNNSTFIDMKTFPKHKHRKTLKIKAYCGKCYQFFQNGPNSKICQEHLNKKCNLISCQKHHKNYTCIRKFPNTNSANRHTHCLKIEDVVHWNEEYEIRNRLLGFKRQADNKNNNNNNIHTNLNTNTYVNNIPQKEIISPIINIKETNQNPKCSIHISSLTQNRSNLNCNIFNATKSIQLFNSTNSLIKIDNNANQNDTLILLPSNNSELNNTKYITINNNNVNTNVNNSKDNSFNLQNTIRNETYQHKWETTTKLCDQMDYIDFCDDSFDNNNPFNNSKISIERKNSKVSQHFFNEQLSQHINNDDDYFSPSCKVENNSLKRDLTPNVHEYEVKLHDSIDLFFDVVQKNTNISNIIKKKLIKAFRKKGILNVRILILAFNKYKNWNFLIEKFKKVTSQIEGVTLFIEYLFQKNNLIQKL